MESKIFNGDSLEVLKGFEDNSIDSIVTDPPYGISFMGKKWDYDVPQVELWKEVLRVLKPGGHALVACGTRTQHRMAVNLEDAGFEIRDIVAWVYGSGFPKSLNIGKAVDKLQGNSIDILSTTIRTTHKKGTSCEWAGGNDTGICDNTKGNHPYEGWGTALKPAMELWTLCRKPLEEKTVAENVLKYGTGGINIDECRVEGENTRLNGRNKESDDSNEIFTGYGGQEKKECNYGRFPANLILDGSDEVVGLFPDSKGASSQNNNSNGHIYRGQSLQESETSLEGFREWYNDSGSASRFFYCAKASKSERNKGLDIIEDKNQRPQGEAFGDGSAITEHTDRKGNFHPTVKPIKLMQYLCRLITPKGGTVLDPFMGSGSTGIGAKLEGFNFIGIELDADYCKIAEARIASYE